jgi:hypothetical protein
MSAENLKNNVSDYQRAYWWDIVIPSLIGGGDASSLEVRAQSTQVPGRSFGEILIPYKGRAGFKVPGQLVMSHIWPCVFVEGLDRKVFDAVLGWKQAVTDARTGKGGPDSIIKKDLYLRLTDGNGNVTNKIKLVGCYPQAMDDVPVAYDTEAVLMYNVTFSYDYWESNN